MRTRTFNTHDRHTIRYIREVEKLIRSRTNERHNWQSNSLKAISVLQKTNRQKAFDYLRSIIQSPDYRTKHGGSWAILALGYIGDSRALDVLVWWLEKSNGRYSDSVVETLGRLGDARGLLTLASDSVVKRLDSFNGPFALSWAYASIAAKAIDSIMKREATVQLLEKFQTVIYFDIGLHQMPWFESDMLGYVETLLYDADPHVRLKAAWFLGVHGNASGADLLLAYLALPERSDTNIAEWECINGLITINDRRLVPLTLDLFDQADPPPYIVTTLYLILSQWGETLTDMERDRFTQAVPKILSQLPQSNFTEVDSYALKGIQLIGTKQADMLLDSWLTAQLAPLFQPYIDHGVNGVDDAFFESVQKIIIHGFAPKANVLTYPFVGQYAFQILRERYEILREQNERHDELDWTIAHIGWLGDKQALPFLESTFDRLVSQMPSKFAWHNWPRNQTGEIFYAIVNLGMVESVPFFVRWVPEMRHINTSHEAFRDFVLNMPDQRIIEALLTHFAIHEVYGSYEIIHAMGLTGRTYAVPGLIRLLSQWHEPIEQVQEIGEVITALTRIAKANLDNAELVNTILAAFKPLLVSKEVIYLSGLFHPVRSMPIDQHTVLALQVIDTPGAQSLIRTWRAQNS